MIEDHPDTQDEQYLLNNLMLPAYPEGEQSADEHEQCIIIPSTYPEINDLRPIFRLVHRPTPSLREQCTRIAYSWRADPVYKILIVAITMAFLAAAICTVLFASTPTSILYHINK